MTNFKFLSITPLSRALSVPLRYLHNKPDAVVIAAAARTPWGKYQGQLASASAFQLGQLAVEAAVKQSAMPLEQIQQIFMNENPKILQDQESEFIFSKFLKKSQYTPLTVGDKDEPKMECLLKALEALKCSHCPAVVAGGLESATQKETLAKKHQDINSNAEFFAEVSSEVIENYISKCVMRYLNSQTEGLFDGELVPLVVQQQVGKRRVMKEIMQDEIFPEICREDNRTFQYSDGAAALVLTTFGQALKLKLSPLAVITDFEYIRNTSTNMLACSRKGVENLFAKTQLHPHVIQHWEIEDSIPQMVAFLQHFFDLNLELINPQGGSLVMGHSAAASLIRLITHLTHALKPFDNGCVVSANSQESLALIIQKLPSLSSQKRLPLITLYTKDPCPLCDVLLEELELNFPGEYELEKIFIDTKESLRFLRLYRLDIPVVFLNNQFLCMHRLNHRLLRNKLNLIKK